MFFFFIFQKLNPDDTRSCTMISSIFINFKSIPKFIQNKCTETSTTNKNIKNFWLIFFTIPTKSTILILQIIFHFLLLNHQSEDAYVYPELEACLASGNSKNSFLKAFLSWDAQYFSKISVDGYTEVKHTVFFPGLPFLVGNLVGSLLNLGFEK